MLILHHIKLYGLRPSFAGYDLKNDWKLSINQCLVMNEQNNVCQYINVFCIFICVIYFITPKNIKMGFPQRKGNFVILTQRLYDLL